MIPLVIPFIWGHPQLRWTDATGSVSMISQRTMRTVHCVDRPQAFTRAEVRSHDHLLRLVGDSIHGKGVHLAVQFTANLWSQRAHLTAQYPQPGCSSVWIVGVKIVGL
jgi:hypothetical protein